MNIIKGFALLVVGAVMEGWMLIQHPIAGAVGLFAIFSLGWLQLMLAVVSHFQFQKMPGQWQLLFVKGFPVIGCAAVALTMFNAGCIATGTGWSGLVLIQLMLIVFMSISYHAEKSLKQQELKQQETE